MKKYAELVVQEGINLQEGQDVYIFTSVNNIEIARYMTEAAYKAKARKVFVKYQDDEIIKMNVKYQKQIDLNTYEDFEIAEQEYWGKKLPCFIHIEDRDPDSLKGMNMKKFNALRQAKYPIAKKYRDMQENRYQWIIVAMPSIAWAKKVFPNLSDEEAFKRLEDLIVKCTHLDDLDPIKTWKKHKKALKVRAKMMNDFQFDHLIYTSSNGTNFTVGLHPKHEWLSATMKHLNHVEYTANMPTEEVFTLPDKYRADGIVFSTKPLTYQGNLIEDFSVQFKKGKAVKVKARIGQEHLEQMIAMDEGAAYLGEVALVPYNSPINTAGVLFYNVLYDENASCHLALGFGIQSALRGNGKMSQEDLKQENFNQSMNHVDFMIGSKDLKIVGVTTSGKKKVIFKDGVWAI